MDCGCAKQGEPLHLGPSVSLACVPFPLSVFVKESVNVLIGRCGSLPALLSTS